MTKIDRGPEPYIDSEAQRRHRQEHWHAICDRAEAAEADLQALGICLRGQTARAEAAEALAARYREALERMAELVRAMDFDAHRTDVADAIAAELRAMDDEKPRTDLSNQPIPNPSD